MLLRRLLCQAMSRMQSRSLATLTLALLMEYAIRTALCDVDVCCSLLMAGGAACLTSTMAKAQMHGGAMEAHCRLPTKVGLSACRLHRLTPLSCSQRSVPVPASCLALQHSSSCILAIPA